MVILNLTKYRIILTFLLATGFLIFTSGVAMGAIWYVDVQAEPDPTDCNRGDTWAKAFKIINKAHECASAGDAIWVKGGVYDFDNWPEINLTKAVSIYGSFAGDEVHKDDRDLKTHRTIIKDVYAPFQIRADTIIDGFEFTGCSAPFFIGDSSGVYAPSVVISNIITYRCTWGAEIYAGSVTFTNYTISDNYGGAFGILNNSSVTFTNCTFWGNNGNPTKSLMSIDSSATFTNCIYWGDTLAFGNLHPDSSKLTATYSNIEGGYPGEGNIDADPLFFSDSDFHLTTSSPCIDTGTSEGAPNHDFEGDVRPQGLGYDMGADEYLFNIVQNPNNGHYYQLVEVHPGVNWYEAKDAAAAMEYDAKIGHLATLTSTEEEEFVVSNFPQIVPNYVWLGATDEEVESEWKWITGEPWLYTNWDPGEPNGSTFENCLDYADGSDKWNDESCERELYYYLVEYSHIDVDINIHPKVLNFKSKGKKIISGIRLPEEYDPHDIARDSLELSIPSCSGCEVIYPTCGFPLWKRYLAFFPRQDLIDEIETIDLNLPTKLDLKITGELDDGTPFEGLDTIRVINKRKKWRKRK